MRVSYVMDQWDMGEGRWERGWFEGEQCDTQWESGREGV